MNKINVKGQEFKIKTYLTEEEKIFILDKSIEAYEIGGMLDNGERVLDKIYGFDKNPISKNITFNIVCLNAISEDLAKLDYQTLLEEDVFRKISNSVEDVRELKEALDDIINKKYSLEFIIGQFLEKISDKIPTSKQLQSLSKSIMKDLNNPKNKDAVDNLKELLNFKKSNII